MNDECNWTTFMLGSLLAFATVTGTLVSSL
jgi:hypothetical protein